MATASTLCGALLAENGQSFRLSSTFVGQQWLWFYIAIMASSFVGGELVERLPPFRPCRRPPPWRRLLP